MTSLLFGRVLLIIAGMLGITTIASRYNKSFETQTEYWMTLIATFVVLFGIYYVADSFPMNLVMVALFS